MARASASCRCTQLQSYAGCCCQMPHAQPAEALDAIISTMPAAAAIAAISRHISARPPLADRDGATFLRQPTPLVFASRLPRRFRRLYAATLHAAITAAFIAISCQAFISRYAATPPLGCDDVDAFLPYYAIDIFGHCCHDALITLLPPGFRCRCRYCRHVSFDSHYAVDDMMRYLIFMPMVIAGITPPRRWLPPAPL